MKLSVLIFSCGLFDLLSSFKWVDDVATIYWEMKPFIYSDASGNLIGIFHEVFSRGQMYCSSNSSDMAASAPGISFHRTVLFPQRKLFLNFLDKLTLNQSIDDEGMLKKINVSNFILGPIVRPIDPLWADKHGFQLFQLASSSQLAIIVPRYEIQLTTKIMKGLKSCLSIFLILCGSSLSYCVLIWLAERSVNEQFPESFCRGFGSAIWWSIASMTTVGYGDLVPKTPIGRLLALGWLCFGVLSCCLMTARMTHVVNSVDFVVLENMPIAVLRDSYEMNIIEHDYKGKAVPAESYQEVLRLVRQGEAYAGVVLGEVAAWHQERMHEENTHEETPLAIVKSIYGNTRVMMMISNSLMNEAKDLLECMYRYHEEVFEFSEDVYNKYLFFESVHIESDILNMSKRDTTIRTLVIIVSILITLGLAYDLVGYIRSRDKGGRTKWQYIRWFFGREILHNTKHETLSKD